MTARFSLVLALFVGPACSDPPDGVAPVPDAQAHGGELDAASVAADAAAVIPAADAAPPAAACTAQLAAGDHDYTVSVGGRPRTYRVHVPPGLDATTRVPLLLNLHPLVLNGAGQAIFSNMNPTSDARGIIVAYPDGLNGSWNGGSCCGMAAQQGHDDVGFMRAMIAEIKGKACIDGRRVYATGMSNGAYLSHRLACEASDVITAIAPDAGVIGIPHADCRPARPVPVLHFHGTADTLVEYAGVAATMTTWAERNGCTDTAREIYRQGAVHCELRDQCRDGAQVILCTAEGGGHCWPGGTFCPVGTPIRDIDGNNYMLDFFARFAL